MLNEPAPPCDRQLIHWLNAEPSRRSFLDINDRHPWACWWHGHDWVDCYIRTGDRVIPVHAGDDFEADIRQSLQFLGQVARVCRHCKQIECLHLFDPQASHAYKWLVNKYTQNYQKILVCLSCGVRLGSSVSIAHVIPQSGCDLLREAALSLGRTDPFDMQTGGWGSGWLTQIPTHLDQVIETEGIDAARAVAIRLLQSKDVEMSHPAACHVY